ncbi:hypothetical protein SSX86_019563 [Deinandra increscens subsp. villosa]|uniref:Pentatricopeptide repeat-containing protein n=1 Tax=Deinandra increscens subsp. villosa TaxID=3103831 RepID=A0AAP0CY17_9ASTR
MFTSIKHLTVVSRHTKTHPLSTSSLPPPPFSPATVSLHCGDIKDSRKVFDDMVDKSVVSWNTVIGGYSKLGYCKEAFLLFRKMRELGVEPDDFTFVSLLSVCAQNCQEVLGELLHSYIVTTRVHIDIYVQNAIVDMYAKCGHLQSAQTFFDRMSQRNVVSWTSMVSAYAKYGLVEPAKSSI